ncbi:MAG: pyridoxal phosphate-dependent aminotransferase [Lachnospiraceae bacterium]|nr:pyridoxal phosphate-dependent aminotransferase [Lachnospiraceae bacterium]
MSMKFDQITDRNHSFSLKWDVTEGELPMWVADMDFETAPAVVAALKETVERGIFGYSIVPKEYYAAVSSWWRRRYGVHFAHSDILFATGVIPALSSIVRKITTVGEKVVIQPPVYSLFYNCIQNNGRIVLENPLHYENGCYQIDFVDLEQKLSDPQTTMMILCNPHNPIGKSWKKEDLARIGELAKQYHVTVIADEIHCDLTDVGISYTPFVSASETCRDISITCVAPSKTFNLAGLQSASVIVPNPVLRHKVWRGLNTDEVAEPNAFAMGAAIAAYTGGEDWLEELRGYLTQNRRIAIGFIKQNIPRLKPIDANATYLLWIDCSAIAADTRELCTYLRQQTGLYVSDGAQFGGNGRAFIRINLATQRDRVLDGLCRLRDGVSGYDKKTAG